VVSGGRALRAGRLSYSAAVNRVRFLALALGLALGACDPPNTPPTPPDVAAVPPGVEITASGLASRVLKPGTGTEHPDMNSTVTVHYSGWTTDGKLFDSSVRRGAPTTFRLDEVIPGWSEGLSLMVFGEKRRLWIPEELAYQGARGHPHGMLVFDVELLAIQ